MRSVRSRVLMQEWIQVCIEIDKIDYPMLDFVMGKISQPEAAQRIKRLSELNDREFELRKEIVERLQGKSILEVLRRAVNFNPWSEK